MTHCSDPSNGGATNTSLSTTGGGGAAFTVSGTFLFVLPVVAVAAVCVAVVGLVESVGGNDEKTTPIVTLEQRTKPSLQKILLGSSRVRMLPAHDNLQGNSKNLLRVTPTFSLPLVCDVGEQLRFSQVCIASMGLGIFECRSVCRTQPMRYEAM